MEMSKALFGLSKKSIESINSVFSHYTEIDKVILYGSRATGSNTIGSDIDLTIDAVELSLQTLQRIEHDLDDLLLPSTIDLSVLAQIQSDSLLEHIDRVGKDFYSKHEKARTTK